MDKLTEKYYNSDKSDFTWVKKLAYGGINMVFITSDKVKIYYDIQGKGEPWIFIHGGPGAWSYNFQALGGKSLEDFMKVIYFDQRGCGRSSGDENSDYSIDRIVKDIDELRQELKLNKVNIIAHSFGGIFAVNYALKYKENVDKIILLNCTVNMKESMKQQFEHGIKVLETVSGVDTSKFNSSEFSMEKWNDVMQIIFERNLFYKYQYEDEKNFIKTNVVDEGIENRAMANQSFSNKEYFNDFYPCTEDIDVPVLVIAGKLDYAIGPQHHRNFKFPNMCVKEIQGSHALYMEHTDEMAKVIREFLQ